MITQQDRQATQAAIESLFNDAIAFANYMANTPLENIEVWYQADRLQIPDADYSDDQWQEPGWYYWHCLPGCMSNDYPHGPYRSEQAATIAAYNEQYEEEVS